MRPTRFTPEDRRSLAHDRFHHPDPRVQRKMEVLWLKSHGLGHDEIAAYADVSRRTVQRYLEEYREGGLPRLRRRRWHQPQGALSDHQESLEGESLDYLRRHAPVGCRDWSTVHLLLDHGVPAFFSGCLTTTVDMLFPGQRTAGPSDPVALVDLVPGTEPTGVTGPTVTVHHSGIGVRGSDFRENLRLAVRVLDSYRRDVSSVVTSRLHCYLPVRALGVPVDFRPKDAHDIRFQGLAGISDEDFGAMQDGLRTKLEAVLASILSGADESAVRRVWADVCAADVAEAQRRHSASAG